MTDGIIEVWRLMAVRDGALARRNTITVIVAGEMILALTSHIHRWLMEIHRLKHKSGRAHQITPDMIERAREYPFEELYPFKKHMALCPFHDDKNPSMSLKNNRARCWSCGWSGDTIAFLMAKESIGFAEAVRRLC